MIVSDLWDFKCWSDDKEAAVAIEAASNEEAAIKYVEGTSPLKNGTVIVNVTAAPSYATVCKVKVAMRRTVQFTATPF